MGFRPCFSSLPIDQCELPNGPRLGTVSRPGYEVAWDAAGNSFPKGERDDRIVLTVDDLPQKRKDCLGAFDRTGAAGCGSPREEVRAFTIDDHNRRARSEPPKTQMSRVTQMQSMQVFGVPLDIENGLCGRRQRCETEPSEPTRQQDAQRAMKFRDIQGVLARKHFDGNHGPRELLSPRLEKSVLAAIDIDSCTRRGQPVKKNAANDILPTSECYSLECPVNYGAWRQAPRSRSFDYFEKTLQAERYAKLLGRPNIESDKEFQRARLVALLEEQKKGRNQSPCTLNTIDDWTLNTIDDCETEEIEREQSIASNEQLEHDFTDHCMSTMSTTASEVSCAPLTDFQRARLASLAKKARREVGGDSAAIIDADEDDFEETSNALPMGLRRVVASLGFNNGEMLSDCLVKDLKRAIGSSADKIRQSRGKTSTGAKLRAASRNRGRR